MTKIVNIHGTDEGLITDALPAEYDLLDKDGNQVARFPSAQRAGEFARYMWPKQGQDEDRAGLGWDIQIVR